MRGCSDEQQGEDCRDDHGCEDQRPAAQPPGEQRRDTEKTTARWTCRVSVPSMRWRRSGTAKRVKPAALDHATIGTGSLVLGTGGLAVQLVASDVSTLSTMLEWTGGVALAAAFAVWIERRDRRAGTPLTDPLPPGRRRASAVRTVLLNAGFLVLIALLCGLVAPEVAALGGFLAGMGVLGLLRARQVARVETERGERLFLWGETSRYYAAPRSPAAAEREH